MVVVPVPQGAEEWGDFPWLDQFPPGTKVYRVVHGHGAGRRDLVYFRSAPDAERPVGFAVVAESVVEDNLPALRHYWDRIAALRG